MTMKKIKWTDSWNIGIDIIDDQHKTLMNLLNRIIDKDVDSKELLIELVNYSGKHFSDEESLMFKKNYPEDDFNYHREEHKNFTDLLLDISFEFLKSRFINHDELLSKFKFFCFTWFEVHVVNTDKKLGDFLKNIGGDVSI